MEFYFVFDLIMLVKFLGFVEAVAQRCSVKKVFLEILRNSLESTCERDSEILQNF